MTGGDAHSKGIDYLVDRLLAKGREPRTNVLLFDHRYLYSDADVLTTDVRNGKTYVTRYEIKTSPKAPNRRDAHKQARAWYCRMLRNPTVVPNFVFYDTHKEQFERWKPY